MSAGQGDGAGSATSGVEVRLDYENEDRLVPSRLVDEYLYANDRLTRSRAACVFFAGAALGTLTQIGTKGHADWVVALLIVEVVAALGAGLLWLSQRDPVTRARTSMTNTQGAVVSTKIYNAVNTSAPPTTPAQDEPPEVTGGP